MTTSAFLPTQVETVLENSEEVARGVTSCLSKATVIGLCKIRKNYFNDKICVFLCHSREKMMVARRHPEHIHQVTQIN